MSYRDKGYKIKYFYGNNTNCKRSNIKFTRKF